MRFVLPVILFALLAPSAHAYPKLPNPLPPVKGNPADTLLDIPIEDFVYDRAAKCKNRRNAGITALANWLGENTRGVFWGSYRCEKWGKNSASLHAENRAIDWHLDAFNRADRRAADKLFRLLLAPDKLGNPQALARRMGVRGADLGLRVLGDWDDRVPALQRLLQAQRQEAQAVRPHRRPPGPHPHRDDASAGAKGLHELLDGQLS